MNRSARRKKAVRKLKIGTVALAAGAFVFFWNGGVEHLVWASMAGAVMAGIVGAAAHFFYDGV